MEEKTKCGYMVHVSDGSWGGSKKQCKRAAVEDGFCRQHHPDRNAEKQAKWQAEWAAKEAGRKKQSVIATAERAVVEAAERWRDDPCNSKEHGLGPAVDALRKARAL